MSTFEDNLCNVLWIWIKPSRPTWGLRDWEEEKDMIWLQLWIGGWNQIVDTHPPLVPGGGIMGEKLVTKDKNRDGLPERWLKDWNCWGNLGRGTWPIQSGARVRPLRGLRERKARSGSGVWGGYWWVVGTGTGSSKQYTRTGSNHYTIVKTNYCQSSILFLKTDWSQEAKEDMVYEMWTQWWELEQDLQINTHPQDQIIEFFLRNIATEHMTNKINVRQWVLSWLA